MKKLLTIAIALILSLSVVPFAGCGSIKGDSTKTLLYIGNYDGGVGSRWLSEYEKGFEKLYENTSFEEGKTGVDVVVVNDKNSYAGNNLLNNMTMPRMITNVIFSEGVKLYDFIDNGWLADITDIVENENIPGEEKTIADKMTDTQKAYYKDGGKYYAIPHYNVYTGIVYDIDLFNKYGLYITSNENGNVTFGGKRGDSNLSAGPDGDITTTYDNGLPATFDEFYKLCDRMVALEIIPICWSVNNGDSYSRFIIDAVTANVQGATEAASRYTVTKEGSMVDMITSFNGNEPVVESKLLSQENYSDINKMEGVYYSHDFLYNIVKGGKSGSYYYADSFLDTQTKDLTQFDYLYSSIDESIYDKPIAMMVEGTWWEEEASNTFNEMVEQFGEVTEDGKNVSREKRNFGFMPMPQKDYDSLGNPVMLDSNNSMVFINSVTKGAQLTVAKKFLQYISTEQNLKLFAQMTGVTRDYQTTAITEADIKTTFAKTVYELKNNATTVYGRNIDRDSYVWYKQKAAMIDLYTAQIGNNPNSIRPQAAPAFKNDSTITSKIFFEGLSSYINGQLSK